MKKQKDETKNISLSTKLSQAENKLNNTIRVQKENRKRIETTLNINDSVQGESIEIMLERIREGEGEDAISDRDLVYNDNESSTVNPITNIRTDKFEAMLDEKIGQYEYQSKKHQKITEDIEKAIEEENKKLNEKEGKTESGTQE